MTTRNTGINEIIIDDGSKVYDIKNKAGKVLGQFEFRPADTNIVQRYEEVAKNINNIDMQAEGTDEEKMRQVETAVVEQLDYLINADSKEAFFSIMGPLSPLASGEFFAENCITAIGGIIEKELDVRLKKTKTRVNKYAQKYHK